MKFWMIQAALDPRNAVAAERATAPKAEETNTECKCRHCAGAYLTARDVCRACGRTGA